MIRGKYLILLASALVLSLNSGCSQRQAKSAEAVSPYPRQSVELIAPAGVRSGSDLTLRSVAQCLRDAGLVDVPLPVTNRPGNGGGLALDYLNEHIGADDALAVFSPPVCLIHLNGSTPLSYHENTTPIAKLVTDYGCFAVASNSPYQNLNQVMEALREDPGSVRVGGTSSVGSMDHVQFLKVAQAAGTLLPDGIIELAVGPEAQAAAVVVIPGGHVAQDYFGIGNLPGLRIIVEPDDAGVFPAAVHICMRDIDVVLAAVFAEIGIKGNAEHAFMLRPDLHVRNAADELFLACFGIHTGNAAPLALGNPNMIIRPPDHIPRSGKAFGDNDPFKRFRRGHRLCLLRRCAPRSRSAQKQQRHRACPSCLRV